MNLHPDFGSNPSYGMPYIVVPASQPPVLVRYDEIRAGAIRHALRFTVENTQRAYVHPATHFASSDTNPDLPPMGLRLRTKASFATAGYSPEVQVILGALDDLKTIPESAFEVVKAGSLHNLDTTVVRLAPGMPEGLTINEAAETTGWSPRMLRYIESAGLIELPRTPSGYRIFGPGELQRLRTLRELLARFDCALSDVAFARRLASDERLRASLDKWFEERPQRPEGVDSSEWLHWEQEKHERLLALDPPSTPITENAVA